jgi:hypothetical protein
MVRDGMTGGDGPKHGVTFRRFLCRGLPWRADRAQGAAGLSQGGTSRVNSP